MPVPDRRLTTVLLHRDELVIITSPQHPLALLKTVLVADLARQQLLVPKHGRTRDTIERLFEDQKLRPTISMELDSSELMKRFVAADVGIGFIARSNVRQDVANGTLVELAIPGTPIRRDLGLVFRKDKALSRAALAFIDIAVKLKTPQAATGLR
jgi:DNA-binding transcriptional LysR family regulator